MLLLVACASIGAPDGGIYDEIPPQVLACYPADRSVDVSTRKMRIRFNEFIKLENANDKVIVSPPQLEPANIRAEGKNVKITLYDSLMVVVSPNKAHLVRDLGKDIPEYMEYTPDPNNKKDRKFAKRIQEYVNRHPERMKTK